MTSQVPMSQEGYNKLKADLEQMEMVEMPAIAEKIAQARSEGDLKENAEYHAQREAQGMLQARINLVRSKLQRAIIVDPDQIPRDQVAFGATVRVLDVKIDEEETITLVGEGDEDYDQGRYLITSPIGQGLVGKKKGETVEIPVPRGKLVYKILDISYDL